MFQFAGQSKSPFRPPPPPPKKKKDNKITKLHTEADNRKRENCAGSRGEEVTSGWTPLILRAAPSPVPGQGGPILLGVGRGVHGETKEIEGRLGRPPVSLSCVCLGVWKTQGRKAKAQWAWISEDSGPWCQWFRKMPQGEGFLMQVSQGTGTVFSECLLPGVFREVEPPW